jgi:serine/threonine protein kinase
MDDRYQDLSNGLSGRYALERELGHGGMATVWLARDLRYDRLVALKVLRPELAASLGAERFLREIMLAARLQHPHIVSVYDSGEIESAARPGVPILWFTMPYIDGESLRERLRREGRLGREEALAVAREVARGLQYAHEHGVIHRDVKPQHPGGGLRHRASDRRHVHIEPHGHRDRGGHPGVHEPRAGFRP